MPLPLEGIRVLDWTIWQQGPVSTMMLGDLGAEVIKIEERVGGDPGRGIMSIGGTTTGASGQRNYYFEANNRHKKSITLNLKDKAAREASVAGSLQPLPKYISCSGLPYRSSQSHAGARASTLITMPPSSHRNALRSRRVASSSTQMPMAHSTGTNAQLQPPAITASAAAAAERIQPKSCGKNGPAHPHSSGVKLKG